MDVRCEAFKKDGKRCTRKGNPLCAQHQRLALTTTTTTCVGDVEPWTARGMPAPCVEKLRPHMLQKLRRKLKAGPRTTTAKSGSIYVYCLDGDEHANLYKVGMTSSGVDKRLQAWARKHKGKVLRKVAEYVVLSDVAWVERVIHLYLDYCRVYRYPGFSVWAATGEPLVGENAAPSPPPPPPHSLLAVEKMIEWFALPFTEIDQIVLQVR